MEAIAQVRQHIQDMIDLVLGKKDEGSLRAHLAKSTVGTFALRIASTGLGFLSSLLLARLLGATGYGVYAYVMSIVALLMIPVTLGLPQLIIRNISTYRTRSEWNLMRGLLRWSNWALLTTSVALALLGAFVIKVLSNHFQPQAVTTFWIAMLALPFMALSQIRQAMLQGLNHIIEGQLPEMFIRPLLFIILIGGTYFFLGWRMNAPSAMGMQVVASGVAFWAGAILLQRHLPLSVKEVSPSYEIRAWIRSALPLLFIGGIGSINQYTDILMLGAFKGAEDVGIYMAATRGAFLIGFMLGIVNTVIAPTISNLYAEGDMKRLQLVVTKSARFALLFSLPLVLGFIIFGKNFLLLFGPEFLRGTISLVILSVGQLVNVAAGSVGLILIMTGHEEDTLKGLVVATIANIILNIFLIPFWGLEGAAIASGVSMIIWNILLGIRVHRKLDISPSAIGVFSYRRDQ